MHSLRRVITYALGAAAAVHLGCGSTLPAEDEPIAQDAQPSDWLWTVAHHPSDSSLLVTGGTSGTVYLLAGGCVRDSVVVGGTVTELRWHPGGQLIAIAVQDGVSAIADVRTGALLPLAGLHEFGARAVGWDPSGERLAVGDYAGDLSLYDTAGGLLERIHLPQKAIIGLDWSPDGRSVATVGDDLVLYDPASGRIRVVPDRDEDVLMLSVAFHPSGGLLATGDYGDQEHGRQPLLQLWDTSGVRIRVITDAAAEYRSLEWSRDGKLLAAVCDELRISTRGGELAGRRTVAGGALLWGVSWAADGGQVAVTDERGGLHVVSADLSASRRIGLQSCHD